MSASRDLFGPVIKPARKPARVMMHVVDAGASGTGCYDDGEGGIAVFECSKCGHRTDWQGFRTITEAKRGVPCPQCNRAESGQASVDEQSRRTE